MDNIINVVASNTAVAAMLALFALTVTRVWRNPHLAHALWLLVLIKLVTPPIATVSLPQQWCSFEANDEREISISSLTELSARSGHLTASRRRARDEGIDALSVGARFEDRVTREGFEWVAPQGDASFEATDTTAAPKEPFLPSLGEELVTVEPPATATEKSTPIESSPSTLHQSPALGRGGEASNRLEAVSFNWRAVVLIAWLVGALVYAGVLARRCIRFRKVLASANDAHGKWLADAERFANRMGLPRTPIVRVVDARIPPLVWSVGLQPLVLFPQSLMRGLDCAQQQAILVHELAHIRRRDHLVRWLEAVVLVLFWWNPVAWFARRKLRGAEEECCDAWVVWALPDGRRSYGRALLKTVEFLTERPTVLALAGSAFGQFLFKRRIEMILKRKMNRRMSWFAWTVVLLLAVVVLPVAGKTAGDGAATDGEDPTAVQPRTEDSNASTQVAEEVPQAESGTDDRSARAKNTLATNADPLDLPKAQNQNLEQRIQRLEAIVKRFERMLVERTANAAPKYTRRTGGFPATAQAKSAPLVLRTVPVAPPARPDSRGAVLSKDGKRIVVLNSDEKRCELDAFDAHSGRQIWKSQLSLPGARRLGISDDGKTIRVFAGNKIVTVDLATGKLFSTDTVTDDGGQSGVWWRDDVILSEYPIADPVEQHKGRERLLELDVTAAKLKIDAAQFKLEQLKQANARESEIAQAEIAIKQAEVDLQRAQILLDLHRKSRPATNLPAKEIRAR